LDTGEAHVKKLREKGVVQEGDIAVVVESQSDEFVTNLVVNDAACLEISSGKSASQLLT